MKTTAITQKLIRIFASTWFFVAGLVLFALQAGWIALTGLYPQAFDEQYHFGLIQLHAHQWSPFFASQPPGTEQYGAIVRDPSLLYHYLMSFIYRVIDIFTDNQMVQVVLLRFISVGLVVWAFVLFRKLLLLMGLSRAKAQVIVLFFSLLPVFVLLAGQLSYDTMLITVTALTLVWAVQLQQSYLQTKRVDWLAVVRLGIAMLLFSTIKFAYLPVLFAVVVYFVYLFWRARRTLLGDLFNAYGKLSKPKQAAYLISLIIAGWLFAGSIGLNLIRYHEPNPRCNKVLTVQQCMEFGPFARDYAAIERHEHPSVARFAGYPFTWVRRMMRESFFTVYSYFNGEGKPAYYGGQKVPQLMAMGWVWFGICAIGLIGGIKVLWQKPVTRLVLFVSGVYALSVLYIDARVFYRTSYAIAIHGRYLFPVVIALFGCAILGLVHMQRRYLKQRWQPVAQTIGVTAVLLTMVMYTQGGGFGTYILYSGDGSFWSNQQANRTIRDVLHRVILGQ